MKLLLFSLVTLTVFSCKPNHPSGKYICDQLSKTTVVEEEGVDIITDINCIYKQLEFKNNNKVIITISEGLEFSTTYEMDNEEVRIKDDKLDIVLKMRDENTLIGAGFWKGIYKKL